MNWFIAVPVAWAAVAVVLGLVIGNGIRIERGIEPDLPASRVTAGANKVDGSKVGRSKVGRSKVGRSEVGRSEVGMAGAPVAEAGNVLVPAPADAVGSSADEEWPAARVRQASLTGAR